MKWRTVPKTKCLGSNPVQRRQKHRELMLILVRELACVLGCEQFSWPDLYSFSLFCTLITNVFLSYLLSLCLLFCIYSLSLFLFLTPIRMSLSTFTLLPALSWAHFQQSNLISQHEVYMPVEASALNSLNILHILWGGPSHGLAVKSSRWLHKWKMAEVKCFQQPKYVLWTKPECKRLPDITQTVRQDLNQRLRNSGLQIQPSVFCFILIHILWVFLKVENRPLMLQWPSWAENL